jgi:ADP-ribose pyrophosphatase YjhB (NUDIX family)
MKNVKYIPSNSEIHFLARGLLVTKDGNVILCRSKGKEWFFLPGGHIENGESAESALIREIHEEIGDIGQKISSFVGIVENIFERNEGSQHEINVIFEVGIDKNSVVSREEHIEFKTIERKDIESTNILPVEVKKGIIEWFEREEPFYKEMTDI